jgi:hypothetical protein
MAGGLGGIVETPRIIYVLIDLEIVKDYEIFEYDGFT